MIWLVGTREHGIEGPVHASETRALNAVDKFRKLRPYRDLRIYVMEVNEQELLMNYGREVT